jgi:hypothetical protein
MARSKETKGVDLGLGKADKMANVTGMPPGEIDGCLYEGIEGNASGADIDPSGGMQSGSHPAKSQSRVMRFFG